MQGDFVLPPHFVLWCGGYLNFIVPQLREQLGATNDLLGETRSLPNRLLGLDVDRPFPVNHRLRTRLSLPALTGVLRRVRGFRSVARRDWLAQERAARDEALSPSDAHHRARRA